MGQHHSTHFPAEGKDHIDKEINHNVEVAEPGVESNTEDTLVLNTSELHEEMDQFAKEESVPPVNPYKLVENAIKHKKVFSITGGYSTVRHSLRRRGWVEKFFNIPFSPKKTSMVITQKYGGDISDALCEDDADYYDVTDKNDVDNDHPKIPPWEEHGGIYGEMSRMLHDVGPSLFWVLKRDTNDYSFLSRKQMVNHFSNVACFTTKAGLCTNLKNVLWYTDEDADCFFPRCYLLSNDDEKKAFIDDFRRTACMNIVKEAMRQHHKCMEPLLRSSSLTLLPDKEHQGSNVDACSVASSDSLHFTAIRQLPFELVPENISPMTQKRKKQKKRKKQQPVIPVQVLEVAVAQCEHLLAHKTHEDLDTPSDIGVLSEEEWDELIRWSYQLIQEDGQFYGIPFGLTAQCESLMERLPKYFPQFELNGTHNVWIVKPGAKSRGRGIKCYEKLADILTLVSSVAAKIEGKYVVQKYIEHPLLVYNTKFDIRQWFLVTDWNPLTIWFYKDSYLRFCSQQFTLEDFSESIHLSNNAIQKHYKNGPRSPRLPLENMWTNEEFTKYLRQNGNEAAWETKIYPQMKQAVIGSLLVSQDNVEYRKFSFELYGADFMLTEDLTPWLLEINASPSMESSTAVTAKMCKAVLEDTIKVVIDRKLNRNCDIGRFELAYKQPYISTIIYTGVSLCVVGHAVTKPVHKEPSNQKRGGGSNAPVTLDTPGCENSQTGNFSVLGVREILNNILFCNGNQMKPNTKSSYEPSTHHFLYTIPQSLKQANSVDPILRKRGQKKIASGKTRNTKVSPRDKSSSKAKSSGIYSDSVQNGACQQCGRRHTFHLLSSDPTCRCQKCSFVLTHLNTGTNNLSTSDSFHFRRNKIRYSKNKSPDGKLQKAFRTNASFVTGFCDSIAGRLFEPLPSETVPIARPASAHCLGRCSSVPARTKYQNTKSTNSQFCYQDSSDLCDES